MEGVRRLGFGIWAGDIPLVFGFGVVDLLIMGHCLGVAIMLCRIEYLCFGTCSMVGF
jgi:hypothetical protein